MAAGLGAGLAAALGLAGCAGSATGPESSPRPPSTVAAAGDPAPASTLPALRDALLDLRDRDQTARGAMVAAIQDADRGEDGSIQFTGEGMAAVLAVKAIDLESTAFLKQMVADRGWPTVTMVGEDGASAAWILAQHADADPDFQEEVLALMEPLVEAGEADPSDVALLTDRVLQARGKPQRYGTQFVADAEGVNRPASIEDADGVDARRAAVGLPPLAEYARLIAEAYGAPASPEPMPIEPE